jgi:hypothetical protein
VPVVCYGRTDALSIGISFGHRAPKLGRGQVARTPWATAAGGPGSTTVPLILPP